MRHDLKLIISADDFGLSEEVNEAIEIAHREGVLTHTSLMVAGPASADAIRRAKRLPNLRVGLHLVVIEGESAILANGPSTPDDHSRFIGSNALELGVRYFFSLTSRRYLKQEIKAQFRAFKASGLALDHANAHKHMHLHPTVGKLLIEVGRDYALNWVRTPYEPIKPLQAVEPSPDRLADRALRTWCLILRRQIHAAGMRTNDWCFGLRWSGHMTTQRIAKLIPALPKRGISEIYFHPAMAKNARLNRFMPDYAHRAEFDALCSHEVRSALKKVGGPLS